MNIIIKKVRLLAAPEPAFVGTQIKVRVADGSHAFGICKADIAEGPETVAVDWGDGTIETVTAIDSLEHTYSAEGVYTIRISDAIKSLAVSGKAGTPFGDVYPLAVSGVSSNATRLMTLGSSCFRYAANLAAFDFSDSAIDTINLLAFANCSSLESTVGLPRGLATFGVSVFDHCTALRTIRLPTGVKKLSGNLFKDCTALSGRIDLPFVESIVGTVGSVPFIGCTGGITEFHFASANAASVMSSSGYQADETLGTGTAVCKFDL